MRISVEELRDGVISIPKHDGNEVIGFAATELQRYLERMTGAQLPISHETVQGKGPVFTLHLDTENAPPSDAFRIAIAPNSVELRASSPRGVLYAVYALLEKLGCRWVHPGEAQEIVPRLNTLDLPEGEHTETPHIEHRGLALYGLYADTVELGTRMIDWMAKNRLNLLLTSWERPDPTNTQTMFWYQVGEQLLPELQRRGILLDMSEHSTEYFFPRSLYTEHPEWFGLNDGKRNAYQMCYSNKDGVEYFGRERALTTKKNTQGRK